MLVLAYRLMNNCPDSYLKQVMDIFSQTALEICEGQQWDMEFETRSDVTVSEYIEMIRLKTSVLLACALKIGAWLGDAPRQDAELLYRFGENLGLAFQIRDDVLDTISTEDELGKTIGSDAAEKKTTFVSLLGVEECGRLVHLHTEKAKAAAAGHFADTEFLCWLADLLADRRK